MNSRNILNIIALIVIAAITGCASQPPSWVAPASAMAADTPAMTPPTGPPAPPNPDPWPRKFSFAGSAGNVTLMVYQPQVEKWEGNRLNLRAAVGARTDGAAGETFGVIWGTVRTEVNRVARMVTLEDLNLTRSNFPTLADNGASYLQQLQLLITGSSRTIALDRLQASLAASGTVNPAGVAVKNEPPQIIVSYSPAILVPVSSKPVWRDVPDSRFERVINTRALILRKKYERTCFLHVYDGWLSAASVDGSWSQATNLPWRFVAGTNLPPDFSRIPPTSPAGVVLAAVAGTPQAKEALIATSIPQTATIPRTGGPAFTPVFDGSPKFKPIAGTPLQYVVNSPTPIIRVDAYTFYALQAGVWFTATSINGPWTVAATVPAVIYTIPPNSPLYYATFVRVYGSTPEVVYVGYTPGYLGTVVAPDGTVVYGTGYVYEPWVGTVYYPPPVTYGVGAQPVYNPAADMAFGMALGMTTAAMVDAWGSPVY
jgi:hypothetical protein